MMEQRDAKFTDILTDSNWENKTVYMHFEHLEIYRLPLNSLNYRRNVDTQNASNKKYDGKIINMHE